jgi:iron complex outermembrane recepter protein
MNFNEPPSIKANEFMTRHHLLTISAAFTCFAINAVAQTPIAQTPVEKSATDVQAIPQLVISATRVAQEGFNLPMAIDRIDASVIGEAKPMVNLSESLNRVPGIVVQNRQNYSQDLQISSRGFGARSTFGVRGVRLIADGIPATMPDGQGQAATFNLSSAERIEVLRGPFASLYGNSSGGLVQIFTADGPAVPTLLSNFYAGSYGTRKLGLQLGAQAGDLNYVVDLSRFETDGYRAHSAAKRDQLNAKFSMPLNLPWGGGKLTLIANGLDQPDTQDPLGLTRAQVAADPRQVDVSAITFNTRKSIRQSQVGAVYDFGDVSNATGAVQAKLYGGARTVQQFLGQEGNTPLSAGGVVDLDRSYGGVGVRWTRRIAIANQPLTFSVGVDADKLDERRRGFINTNGAQGGLKRDEDDRVSNTDFFAQAEWQIAEPLSISGGARHSRVKFDSRDYYIVGTNPNDSGKVDYSKTTPVLGVLYKIAPRWNVYANYGEGFETPTFAELAYRPNGATGLNLGLQPASSKHVEFGVKANITSNARFNAAVFRIDTKNEIVTNGNNGGRSDFRNASKTQRDGVELSFESVLPLSANASIETYAAYTWLNARFTSAYSAGTPPVVVPSGNILPGVAKQVFYGEAVWRYKPLGFHAGVEYRASSKVYVNEANSDAAAGFNVVNVRAGFQQQLTGSGQSGWRLSEFVRVDNLTDRNYIGSVIVAEARGRFFEPAVRRNYLIGLSAAYSF